MKPIIKVMSLTNSVIIVFTDHITCIETSHRGCIIHLSSGQAIESTSSETHVLEAIGL
jgi:hypothetical protein